MIRTEVTIEVNLESFDFKQFEIMLDKFEVGYFELQTRRRRLQLDLNMVPFIPYKSEKYKNLRIAAGKADDEKLILTGDMMRSQKAYRSVGSGQMTLQINFMGKRPGNTFRLAGGKKKKKRSKEGLGRYVVKRTKRMEWNYNIAYWNDKTRSFIGLNEKEFDMILSSMASAARQSQG